MKQKLSIVLIIILLVLVGASFLWNQDSKLGLTSAGTGLDAGDTPPQFTLETLSREEVSLEQFKGKKVILNFWATWCKPCREEMPAFERYSGTTDDVVVLAVNMTHRDNSQEKIEAFVKENGLSFIVTLDELGDVSKAYKVINIPSTYFIDEEGLIISRVDGAVDETKIAEYIEGM